MHIPRLREKLIQSKLRSGTREKHQMCRQIFMNNSDGNRKVYSFGVRYMVLVCIVYKYMYVPM
jgi:hypothetical protein